MYKINPIPAEIVLVKKRDEEFLVLWASVCRIFQLKWPVLDICAWYRNAQSDSSNIHVYESRFRQGGGVAASMAPNRLLFPIHKTVPDHVICPSASIISWSFGDL